MGIDRDPVQAFVPLVDHSEFDSIMDAFAAHEDVEVVMHEGGAGWGEFHVDGTCWFSGHLDEMRGTEDALFTEDIRADTTVIKQIFVDIGASTKLNGPFDTVRTA